MVWKANGVHNEQSPAEWESWRTHLVGVVGPFVDLDEGVGRAIVLESHFDIVDGGLAADAAAPVLVYHGLNLKL